MGARTEEQAGPPRPQHGDTRERNPVGHPGHLPSRGGIGDRQPPPSFAAAVENRAHDLPAGALELDDRVGWIPDRDRLRRHRVRPRTGPCVPETPPRVAQHVDMLGCRGDHVVQPPRAEHVDELVPPVVPVVRPARVPRAVRDHSSARQVDHPDVAPAVDHRLHPPIPVQVGHHHRRIVQHRLPRLGRPFAPRCASRVTPQLEAPVGDRRLRAGEGLGGDQEYLPAGPAREKPAAVRVPVEVARPEVDRRHEPPASAVDDQERHARAARMPGHRDNLP
jgi:hypothetical protein